LICKAAQNTRIYVIISINGGLRRGNYSRRRAQNQDPRGGQDSICALTSKSAQALLTLAQDKAALLRFVGVTRSREKKILLASMGVGSRLILNLRWLFNDSAITVRAVRMMLKTGLLELFKQDYWNTRS
jgi:hypothetical protein